MVKPFGEQQGLIQAVSFSVLNKVQAQNTDKGLKK